MVLNEADDIRLGSGQVDAVYLGDTLIWPTMAYTYEVSNVVITYSRGSKLDAGAVNSNYTGNYAMASGMVTVKNGSTVVDTKYNEPLSISESSSFLVVVIEGGRDVVKGYNLRNNITQERSAEISVYYRTSTPISGGYVTQVANTDTTITSVTHTTGDPVITEREVPDTRYAVLTLYGYNTSSQPCPAYGGTVSMIYYGGHNVADYSSTPTYEWTTYHHTYTSGYTEDEGPYLTNTDWSNPVKVSGETGVDDTLTLSSLPSWLHYNTSSHILTIDSEGQTEYRNGRSRQLYATNGDVVSAVSTLYQQENVRESSSYAYDIYCRISTVNDFPAAGGTFPVLYRSFRTLTEVWTSGTYTGDPTATTSNVAVTNATASVATVSGQGSFNISVDANTGGTKIVSVTVTSQVAIGQSDSDMRYQQGAALPRGVVYPVVSQNIQYAGRVYIKWEWTSGTTPTPTYPLQVEFTNLTFHYILSGESTEYTNRATGSTVVSFSSNESQVYVAGKFLDREAGQSGRCWFTADGVTAIAYDSTNPTATFPTKTFSVPSPQPINL